VLSPSCICLRAATCRGERGHHLLEVFLILLRSTIQFAKLLLLRASPAILLVSLAAVRLALVEVGQPLMPEVGLVPSGLAGIIPVDLETAPRG
jgi:hypothetical protein